MAATLKNRIFYLVLYVSLFYAVKRNPSAAKRLADVEGKTILLDIEDLGERYRLSVSNKRLALISDERHCDLVIRGRSSVFAGLVMRRLDADELFFSRKLHIEGDIETATHLKNILAQL